MKRSSSKTIAAQRARATGSASVFGRVQYGSQADGTHLRRRPLGRYRYTRLRWRILFSVIDFVGRILFDGSRALRRWLVTCDETTNDSTDPRVILLVQLDHLGDAVISTCMLAALRQRYPEASIEVLAGPWNQVVFRNAPEVDRVHLCGTNRFARGRLGRFFWPAALLYRGWRLRRRKIDLGIDVRGEFPLALLLWLSGARRRVGWACGGGEFLLTNSAAFVPNRPEVASRRALLETIGIAADAESFRPRFFPSVAARRRVDDLLGELSVGCAMVGEAASGLFSSSCPSSLAPRRSGNPTRPLVVIHVGAGTAAKQWPAEHWQELLGRLVLERNVQVVLVGTKADRIITRQILGGKVWPDVADWSGRLNVVELAALVERADAMVGADSGPAHLAAAVGTPVVALFSGTNNPDQWRPCGQRVTVVRQSVDCSPCHRQRCPRAGHPCMQQLTPKSVAGELLKLLPASRVRHARAVNRVVFDAASTTDAERSMAVRAA